MADPRVVAQVRRILRTETGVDAALLPGSLEEAIDRRLEAEEVSSEIWLGRLTGPEGTGQREAAELLSLLGIGHTHLFRHQAVWDVLVQELAGEGGLTRALEVLILGVSTGEEAYTALMQLGTRLGLDNVSALGVDINPSSIAKAIRAEYPARSAEHVPSWAMDRYLDATQDGFTVRDAVRRRARFLAGSLFAVPSSGAYDLVLMRHVLIYFRPNDRRRALDRASGLCRPGGLLVLGASEGAELSGDDRFEVVREGLPVFRKVSTRGTVARAQGRPSDQGRGQPPVVPVRDVLDVAEVSALIHPHLSGAVVDGITVDLRGVVGVSPEAAWGLGRGLRLLALRGTLITVRAPVAGGPRRALMGSLVRELARNGIIRWE